ncbi:MAG: hypothetical protein H7066_09400 [Cytophagaceae bacterium]|nr:hypothetical protein [Gemmatimonadaceae bacterium]
MTVVRLFVLASLALGPAVVAEAQGAIGPMLQSVTVGSRVRVFAPSLRRDRFVGRIDSLDTGEMVLDTAGVRRRLGFEMGPVLVESFRRVRIRNGAIEAIEVSGGRTTRSATLKGAIIGGLVGAALIGFGQAPEVNPGLKDFVRNAPIGFAAGVVIGGGVGYALGGEKWLPAEVPR